MKIFITVIVVMVSVLCGIIVDRTFLTTPVSGLLTPINPTPQPLPFLKYAFNQLSTYSAQKNPITILEEMEREEDIISYLASYTTDGKRMTMQIMVPQTATPSGGFPTLLMVRGYADQAIYQTGVGTKNAAKHFARHGFVTIAPDFLGFGDSDKAPEDSLEARFERPKQLIDLIASFESLDIVNKEKIGIWGHSNGGQITISLLEITQKNYPTVLWAPVTKPFPYSILYYSDESADAGKSMRKVVAQFEQDYDVYDFSIDRYINQIKAPIQLHQGTADEAVPVTWSTQFVKNLKQQNIEVEYFTYPGADHNLRPTWQLTADRSLVFFQKHLYGENISNQ